MSISNWSYTIMLNISMLLVAYCLGCIITKKKVKCVNSIISTIDSGHQFHVANYFKVYISHGPNYKWNVFDIEDFYGDVTLSDKYSNLDEKLRKYDTLVYTLKMKMFESCITNDEKDETVLILVDLESYLIDDTKGIQTLYGHMEDEEIEKEFVKMRNRYNYSRI